MIVYDDQMNVFHSTLLQDSHFLSGFGTRLSGDGRNPSNIQAFSDKNKIEYKSLIVPEQIHSANIENIDAIDEKVKIISTTDGVITTNLATLLSIITGDCVPIIFIDMKNGVIGISHQGWRGTLKKMSARMISAMVNKGSKKEDIKVAIGPAIGACCYQIYGDRLYEFLAEFEDIKDKIFSSWGGKTHINLLYLNYLQLVDYGVLKENIDYFPFCTKCDKNRFFSFQRDDKNSYGEMFSYVMKT